MSCPYCDSDQSSVIDKRAVKSSGEIRRRRKCLKCNRRYTTYERLGEVGFFVIKRDGSRQPFDISKLRSGILKALEKRPLFSSVDGIVSKIEKKIRSKQEKEIESNVIGKIVLTELKKIDSIAYLRFASVYRQFKVPGDFTKELEQLKT